MVKNVYHEPLFDVKKVVKHYTLEGEEPCHLVVSTELPKYGCHADIYYRSKPHPDHGNHYFGLRLTMGGDSVNIFNADGIISELEFGMIYDKESDLWYYSAEHYDYKRLGECIIDGGRHYTRGRLYEMFHIVDGELQRVE